MTVIELSVKGFVRKLMKVFCKSLPFACSSLHTASLLASVGSHWRTFTNESLNLSLPLALPFGGSDASFLRSCLWLFRLSFLNFLNQCLCLWFIGVDLVLDLWFEATSRLFDQLEHLLDGVFKLFELLVSNYTLISGFMDHILKPYGCLVRDDGVFMQ